MLKDLIMKIWIILITLITSLSAWSQSDTTTIDLPLAEDLHLGLIAKDYGDSIVLRWAPSREDGWIVGMNNGYRIQRLELDNNYEPVGDWDTLSFPTIYPYSIAEYKQKIVTSDDDYLTASAESMYGYQMEYGEDFSSKNLLDRADEFRDRFTICLLMADLSSHAATGLGWRYADKDIRPQSTYLYRVYSPGEDTTAIKLDNSVITGNDTSEITTPIIFDIIQKENQVDLQMNRALHDSHFTAYFFERSADNGKSWSLLNALPYTQPLTDQSTIGNKEYIIYRDTGLVNYVPYLYRAIGLTPFGEYTAPSVPIRGMGKDRTPPRLPERFKAAMNANMQMEVNWEYDSEPDDLLGFILTKSLRPFDPHQPVSEDLLPPDTRQYIDDNPTTVNYNFYTLYAVDTAQNVSYTQSTYGEYTDSIPPLPPSNITYQIDTSGHLQLMWPMGQEEDLLGYHVYYANNKKDYLSNISESVLQDTVYTDTLNLYNLQEKTYYRITALDFNYNVSAYSEWVVVERPDIVPPSSPIIIDHRASEESITIEFKKSSSIDVVNYMLLRWDPSTSKWNTVGSLSSDFSKEEIADTTNLTQGMLYKYKLVAEDEAGNTSRDTYTYTARTRLPKLEGKILNASITKEKKKITLEWTYQGRMDDIIRVYRATGTENFTLIKSYDANDKKGFDFLRKAETNYIYKIALATSDAQILDMSDEMIVVD